MRAETVQEEMNTQGRRDAAADGEDEAADFQGGAPGEDGRRSVVAEKPLRCCATHLPSDVQPKDERSRPRKVARSCRQCRPHQAEPRLPHQHRMACNRHKCGCQSHHTGGDRVLLRVENVWVGEAECGLGVKRM